MYSCSSSQESLLLRHAAAPLRRTDRTVAWLIAYWRYPCGIIYLLSMASSRSCVLAVLTSPVIYAAACERWSDGGPRLVRLALTAPVQYSAALDVLA